MRCPICKKEFNPVSEVVFLNAARYGNPATILSKCCNKIVRVVPIRSYRLEDASYKTEYDWGNVPS
jgi:hypothetical protein